MEKDLKLCLDKNILIIWCDEKSSSEFHKIQAFDWYKITLKGKKNNNKWGEKDNWLQFLNSWQQFVVTLIKHAQSIVGRLLHLQVFLLV